MEDTRNKVGQRPTSESDCMQSPSVASTRACPGGWPNQEVGQRPTSESDCMQSPSVASTRACPGEWPNQEVGQRPKQEIRIGDVIQTRKPHPCGSSEWTVTRTGADIKIKCSGCGRIVMLDRETFLKRRKKVITQGPAVTQ